MKKLAFAGFLAVTLAGCYPAGPEYVEDLDVVYTTFDKGYDFAAGTTYSRPDQIVVDVERDDNGNWVPEYMPQTFADQILGYIDDNMEAMGWTRIPNDIDGNPTGTPDIVLTPAAVKSTTYFYSYWYDWWYGGYWGGWYGWYYPPYVTISSYTTGSMIMVIADPNIESPINETQAAWVAVANGLFTGAYDFNRVERAIDQAFAQSPYLKTN
ncbi:DUF4136 domain-containing protein [Oscillatoria amoena NRMC-F 0135]|nr:DUF4136 domain-containing protein [Oscillatoria amoena NRMC-F 0135]